MAPDNICYVSADHHNDADRAIKMMQGQEVGLDEPLFMLKGEKRRPVTPRELLLTHEGTSRLLTLLEHYDSIALIFRLMARVGLDEEWLNHELFLGGGSDDNRMSYTPCALLSSERGIRILLSILELIDDEREQAQRVAN